jgi:hypothetical protein
MTELLSVALLERLKERWIEAGLSFVEDLAARLG